jgi:2-methylcitrate dehydratase PrpD
MNAPHKVTAELEALAAGNFPAGQTLEARESAQRHLQDTIGAIVAGMNEAPARIAATTLDKLNTPGPVIVPGDARKWDALSAAYLMGTAGHGWSWTTAIPWVRCIPGLR